MFGTAAAAAAKIGSGAGSRPPRVPPGPAVKVAGLSRTSVLGSVQELPTGL